MLSLFCLAGAAIYTFPFLRYSYYDPMREALGVTHTQMGFLQSLNGITSTLGYIPGGWLADRYSPRKLLATSLILTGLSGFYFSIFPSYMGAMFLYAFWGVSTLVIFWAPLIKATRELGDKSEQGKLFGFLEGGRGVFGFLLGTLTLYLFTKMGEGSSGLVWVIDVSAVIITLAGVAIWLFLEDKVPQPTSEYELPFAGILTAIKMPKVWIIGGIIFCGYSLFAGQSYVTPYLTNVVGTSIAAGALMGIIRTYGLQATGGPIFGLLADRVGSPSKILMIGFSIGIVTTLLYLIIPARVDYQFLIVINMIVLGLAIFGLRGNYFAIVGESDIPKSMTGAAVGVASFIGFLPEATIYPLIGYWLDTYSGIVGYQITFGYLTTLSVIGLVLACLLWRVNHRSN